MIGIALLLFTTFLNDPKLKQYQNNNEEAKHAVSFLMKMILCYECPEKKDISDQGRKCIISWLIS